MDAKIKESPNFKSIHNKWQRGEISGRQAAKQLGISNAKFLTLAGTHDGPANKIEPQEIKNSQQFESTLNKWRIGEITACKAAGSLGISHVTFLIWARERDKQDGIITKVRLGQKPLKKPENYEFVYSEWLQGNLTYNQAANKLGVSKSTFQRWIGKSLKSLNSKEKQKRNASVPKGRKAIEKPLHFESIYEQWKQGLISANKAGSALGISHTTFLKWAKES